MAARLVNIKDRNDHSKSDGDGETRYVPGVGPGIPVMKDAKGSIKFLGDEEKGPWVYYSERKAGDRIPLHRHVTNRTEFLFSGRIEWIEPGKPPVEYDAGTLSYVDAGTVYGFNVLEDAVILISFEGPPGVHFI